MTEIAPGVDQERLAKRICFVFVCQSGELEAKAVLLAASLRRFLVGAHDLVAAVPIPAMRWGRLSAATLLALKELGVRTVEVENRVSDRYPIANKLGCLAISTDCDSIVFLDSDILMMRRFDESKWFEAPISAVPASQNHISREIWEALYRQHGLDMPEERMITEVSRQRSVPYVNAGLIAARPNPDLVDQWIECVRTTLSFPGLAQSTKFYSDQIALPIAAALCGIEIEFIGREWNFPSWSVRIGSGPPPIFFHYQRAERLLREQPTASLFRSLCEEFPAVREVINAHSAYRAALAQANLTPT